MSSQFSPPKKMFGNPQCDLTKVIVKLGAMSAVQKILKICLVQKFDTLCGLVKQKKLDDDRV